MAAELGPVLPHSASDDGLGRCDYLPGECLPALSARRDRTPAEIQATPLGSTEVRAAEGARQSHRGIGRRKSTTISTRRSGISSPTR
jgi:hypothetical protein